ncbi:MAG: lysophospholipase [Bacteroidales bacterium]|nr:lysophospholipase [Bacteroidales bacterium]
MEIKINTEHSGDLYGIYFPVHNARACIIMIHGLGDHIYRYRSMAEFFNGESYSLIGVDLPGHGRSPGKRGHIRNFAQYNGIISSMVFWIREREEDLPLLLYGHSFGGTIALKYILEDNNIERGIISSPWLKLSFEPPRLRLILASVASRILPSLIQPSGLDPANICSVEAVANEYRNDPLVHSFISVGLFASTVKTASNLLKCKNELKTPVLLMHSSKDRITSAEGSAIFANNNKMADLKIWDKGYHELHNENFRDEVLTYIINWLDTNNGIQDKSSKITGKGED